MGGRAAARLNEGDSAARRGENALEEVASRPLDLLHERDRTEESGRERAGSGLRRPGLSGIAQGRSGMMGAEMVTLADAGREGVPT